jgi:lysophospholipase L1-like esterase
MSIARGIFRKSVPGAVLFLLDSFVLLGIILLPVIWIADPLKISLGPLHFTAHWRAKVLLLPAVVLLLRFVLTRLTTGSPGRGGLLCHSLFKQLLVWILLPFLCFYTFEQYLQARNYAGFMPSIVIADDKGVRKKPRSKRRAIVPDWELLHRFNPGAEFNGRPVNSMGFLDREVDPKKAEGTLRVISMGDSVTGQGPPPYSGILHELLQAEPLGGDTWEAFNMGVHGYSSAQGLRLFQRRAAKLEPDYVTVYFGWNDHWRTSRPDHMRMKVKMARWKGTLIKNLREKKFFQYLSNLRTPRQKLTQDEDDYYLRVPQEYYRQNLVSFAREIRALQAVPILITAPRAEVLTKSLVTNRQVASLDDAYRLHDEYVEITRAVARETGAPLLDLAAIFSGPESAPLFSRDGIHFNSDGLERIAAEIYSLLEELVGG